MAKKKHDNDDNKPVWVEFRLCKTKCLACKQCGYFFGPGHERAGSPVIFGHENVIQFPSKASQLEKMIALEDNVDVLIGLKKTMSNYFNGWNFNKQQDAGVLRKPGFEGYVVLYEGVYHVSVYDKYVRFSQEEFLMLDEAIQNVEKTIQFQSVNDEADVLRVYAAYETEAKLKQDAAEHTGHTPLVCDNPDCDGTCNGLHVPLPPRKKKEPLDTRSKEEIVADLKTFVAETEQEKQ